MTIDYTTGKPVEPLSVSDPSQETKILLFIIGMGVMFIFCSVFFALLLRMNKKATYNLNNQQEIIRQQGEMIELLKK